MPELHLSELTALSVDTSDRSTSHTDQVDKPYKHRSRLISLLHMQLLAHAGTTLIMLLRMNQVPEKKPSPGQQTDYYKLTGTMPGHHGSSTDNTPALSTENKY